MIEIILETTFTALKITSATSRPETTIFKRFKERWSQINDSSYRIAYDVSEIDSCNEHSLQFAMLIC